MTMAEPVLMIRDGGVAHVRFNRPERLNAVDVATGRALLACVREIAADACVRAVVLSGEGKAFGAGGDLDALRGDPVAGAPVLLDPVHEALKLMSTLPVPFIASLHGVVAGGSLSIAMACDLAVAAEGTRFNLSYVNVGASCDGGASWSLPRLVGLRNALAIALLGETFDAAEALRLGLVNKVLPPAETLPAALAIAQRLAAGPGLAIGQIKHLFRTSSEHDLATQLDRERDAFVASAGSEDFRAGMAAFVEKRKPVFKGR
jgi:2-(1,2-epoxy-1,2-dihydrophenyl)acetyl-CoA isomerase